jgi:tRNA 2-thiouridine synthesizing protein A
LQVNGAAAEDNQGDMMNKDITADETLDCRGLSCPMPVLKTKKALGKLTSGQILEVLSTDPGTRNDLPSFAQRAGHEYLGEREDEGFVRFYLKAK